MNKNKYMQEDKDNERRKNKNMMRIRKILRILISKQTLQLKPKDTFLWT